MLLFFTKEFKNTYFLTDAKITLKTRIKNANILCFRENDSHAFPKKNTSTDMYDIRYLECKL